MAKKSFEDLIEDDDDAVNECNNAHTQIDASVTPDHPIVGEILFIKDEEQRQKIVVDITNLIGGLEVGRVLLNEALKGVQAYTDSINKANSDLAANISNANKIVTDYQTQVASAKEVTVVAQLRDGQKKWLEKNRQTYLDDTDKAFAAHHKALQELSAEQIAKFKEGLEKCNPGNVISDRVFNIFVAIFLTLTFGFVFSVVVNISEIHSSTLSWILWIEVVLIILIVGLSLYIKREQPRSKYY